MFIAFVTIVVNFPRIIMTVVSVKCQAWRTHEIKYINFVGLNHTQKCDQEKDDLTNH